MHKIEQLSDQQLMKEIMSDNFKAFTELYNRYKHTLFQFVIRLSHGDYSMAEEVVQETFIIIWENRKKILVEFSFQGYLKKVSRNLFLKETAKRIQEQLMISQIENVREAENCVEDEVELNLLRPCLSRSFAKAFKSCLFRISVATPSTSSSPPNE